MSDHRGQVDDDGRSGGVTASCSCSWLEVAPTAALAADLLAAHYRAVGSPRLVTGPVSDEALVLRRRALQAAAQVQRWR